MYILTLNAGSSSLKYKLFSCENEKLLPVTSGIYEGIGEKNNHFENHEKAFDSLFELLKKEFPEVKVEGVGHRVVHGGSLFFEPTLITDEVLSELKKLDHLAPLHNPVNREGIILAKKGFKDALHVAIFDTGFHHTLPEKAAQYAISKEIAKQYEIRRYGFHGINHQHVAIASAAFLKKPLDTCSFISLHLGNGASACLIKNGKSVDTSMGMTPLAGLIMGTRSGDIDPSILLYLLKNGMTEAAIEKLLNKQSGLLGIGGDNDMRHLIERATAKDKNAILAIEMFVYSIQKIIGAYLSQTPHLDALIFTGGIGENATLIRNLVMKNLTHFGFHLDDALNEAKNKTTTFCLSKMGIPILMVKSDEEGQMAGAVLKFLT